MRRAAVALAALALLLTSCTSDDPGPQTTLPPVSSTTSTVSTSDSTTSVEPITSSDAPTPSFETEPTSEESTTTPPESSQFSQFGLAGQDLIDADAAWSGLNAYSLAIKQAYADPAVDSSDLLAGVSADPQLEGTISTLSTLSSVGFRMDWNTQFSPIGIDLQLAGMITFTTCADYTLTKTYDESDKDVTAPDSPGTRWIHQETYGLVHEGTAWKVSTFSYDPAKAC